MPSTVTKSEFALLGCADNVKVVSEPSPVNASNVNVLRVSSNNDAVIEPAAIAVFSVPGPKPLCMI